MDDTRLGYKSEMKEEWEKGSASKVMISYMARQGQQAAPLLAADMATSQRGVGPATSSGDQLDSHCTCCW